MSSIKFADGRGGTFEMDLPGNDSDDWNVVMQESIDLNKGEFILDEFKKSFPHIKIKSYEELCRIASRSKALGKWLIQANLDYSLDSNLPLFLKNKIKPAEFAELSKDVRKIKLVVASNSVKRQALAEEYQANLAKLEKDEEENLSHMKKKSKILEILTLDSTVLPLSLQLQIDGFDPTLYGLSQENKRMFAREILIQFKKSLVDLVIANPEVDIKKLIEENATK